MPNVGFGNWAKRPEQPEARLSGELDAGIGGEVEQVGDQHLTADITNLEDPIEGNWEVEIPVRLIKEEK